MRVCQFRHPGRLGRAETVRSAGAPVNAPRGGFPRLAVGLAL